MALLDTVSSVLSIVDSVLDGGRSSQASRFALETGEDDKREAALRVANDRQVRQSAGADQTRAAERSHEHVAQRATETDTQAARREPDTSRSDARGATEASPDTGSASVSHRATRDDVTVGHAIGAAQRRGEAAAPAAAIAPMSGGDAVVGAPVRPISEHDAVEAQVKRRATAITLAFRTGGEIDAARELRARTRDLSPALAGEVIVVARATLISVATAFGLTPGGDRIERIERGEGSLSAMRSDAEISAPKPDRSTHLQQIASDVASTVEHAGRGPRGAAIAADIAALILESAGQGGDEYRLSAFARGIPFGSGLTLPLALAEELARQGDRRRQRQMLFAIEQGLARLKQRIAASISALAELAAPLAAFLAAQTDADTIDRDRIATALGGYLARDRHFLDAFARELESADVVGHDAFCALDVLARRQAIAAELCAIRNDLLADPATAFAIAQSASARATALGRIARTDREAETRSAAVTIRAAQAVYAALGFSRARCTLLANAAVTHRSVVQIDARWVASSPSTAAQGDVFEALLRFVGADVPRHIRAIELADVDGENFAHPICGLPLLRHLQQTA